MRVMKKIFMTYKIIISQKVLMKIHNSFLTINRWENIFKTRNKI